jgi:hypothetical protein
MNRASRHLLLLAPALLIVASARVVFHDHYKAERGEIESRASKARMLNLANAWKTLPYSDSYQSLSATFLLKIKDLSNLTTEQRNGLDLAIPRVLQYLFDPDFRKFCDLKAFPAQAAQDGSDFPTDVEGKWSAALTTASGQTGRIIKVSDGTNACKIGILASNSVPAIINGPTGLGYTIMRSAPEIMKANRSLTDGHLGKYVDMAFYAYGNTSEFPGSIHVCLAWVANQNRWVVERMVSDVLLELNLPL